MALLVHQISAVAERLAEGLAFPMDMTLIILTGFNKCILNEFVGPLYLMLNIERVIQLDNDGDMHYNRKCLERLKKITILASNSFHSLKFSNQWNITSNHWHGMEEGKVPCDNCGEEHYSTD